MKFGDFKTTRIAIALITVYAQDADGAYFIYDMECSEADAEKLVPGAKIKVSGYKAEWSGEVEIVDATFEFVEGADPFVAEAKDLTDKLGTDELIDFIVNWEVESYRAKVSLAGGSAKALAGKIAIVTGSAQGFGAGIAKYLANEGASVVIADMNIAGAEKTAAEITEETVLSDAE